MIEDLKQTELDMFEQAVLDKIFGGHEPENMIISRGIFKINVSDEVQSFIDRFEGICRPLMDEQGRIDGAEVKKYLSGIWADIVPENKMRLIDLYRQIEPVINKILGV